MTKNTNSNILVALPEATVAAASVTLPADRTYRDAWHLAGKVVQVDMTVARDIHRNRLRAERQLRFAPLDAAFLQGLETGGDTEAAVTMKRRLRDVTCNPRIEHAQSVDQLKSLTLDTLL
ncbi:MAG: hypothetical protein ACK4Z4_03680 [Ferrovibrio sp.]